MGSQDLKAEHKPRSNVLLMAMAVALVVAGAMIFAGTIQLRQMRDEFGTVNRMLSIMKRELSGLQEEKAATEQKLAEREKDVDASVELLGRRSMEMKELNLALAARQVELDEKDRTIDAKTTQVEVNKNAAKKLALVLAQTQADKEKLKTETAALIKPEIDRCNEAMAAKDAAIQALMGERDKADTDIAKAEREVAKLKKEVETLQGKLDSKRVEADSLRLWKDEASKEFKQQAERSKSIWTASVIKRDSQPRSGGAADGAAVRPASPVAVPPSAVSGPVGLAAHLQHLSKASGLELGLATSNFTQTLLGGWPFAKSYVLLDVADEAHEMPTVEEMKAKVKAFDGRIRYLRAESIDSALEQVEDETLDFMHLTGSYGDQAADEGLLLRCWSKLRDGGILAGGYARPDSVDGAMRAAVIAFAETTSRQPLLGLDAEHAGIWLVRK